MDDALVNVLWAVLIFADIMIDAVIIGLIMKKPVNHTMIIHRLLGHLMIKPR